MRDQVKIKNVEIRVIKWDRVRNDDREKKNEERESNGLYLLQIWVKSLRRAELLRLQIMPKRAELLVLPWRIHGHNISNGIASFLGKTKLEIIFMKLVERVTNLND